ncbi:unnamed protein product, partial [marine sediment metagenome]
MDNKTVRFFQNIDYKTIKPFDTLKEVLKEKTALNDEEIEKFMNCDEDQNVLIYMGDKELDQINKNAILEIFEKIHLNGPLCSEKLSEIKVTIENLNLDNDSQEYMFTELSTMLYDAIKKGLTEAELVLLEPIWRIL